MDKEVWYGGLCMVCRGKITYNVYRIPKAKIEWWHEGGFCSERCEKLKSFG